MEDNELMSRIEKILHKMLGDEIELDEAQSRNEELLIQVLKLIENITFITSADIVTEQELSDALAGYYDKGAVDTALGGKAAADHNHSGVYAPASHTHAQADVTGLEDALSSKAPASHTHAQADITGLSDALAGKSAVSHFHDDRYYTESEVDTALAGKAAASHSHDDRYYTESEIDTALSGKAAASHVHAQSDVTGLDSALAGKAAVSHAHDDRYYTETEIDNKLGEKSNTGHTHDDRYYTEAEVDTLLSGKADSSDIPDVSAFITRLVNDLVNYYTKSETYTKAEIDSKVSAIPKFAIKPVNSLPIQDISDTTVYLLTVQNGEQGNMYDEYIYVGNTWEKLGTQTIDLSGYYTAAEVDALLSNLSVSGHTHDDRYYTETEIDGKIQTINTALSGKAASDHTHDDRYYTETEIDNKLSVKSNTGHSHVVADVTGLDSALSGKAPASHTHTKSQISDLSSMAPASGGTDTSLCTTGEKYTWNGKAPASHTHAQSDVVGLADTLANISASVSFDVLFESANGTALSASSSITLTDPLTSAHKYVEIYYQQTSGCVACVKGIISSGATSFDIQLLSIGYDSATTALSFVSGAAAIAENNGDFILSVSDGSFTVYRVVAYS